MIAIVEADAHDLPCSRDGRPDPPARHVDYRERSELAPYTIESATRDEAWIEVARHLARVADQTVGADHVR